jgi:competence protein ComEC
VSPRPGPGSAGAASGGPVPGSAGGTTPAGADGPADAAYPGDTPGHGEDPPGEDGEHARPPTGRVLGPLPLWACVLLAGAGVGEQVALRLPRPAVVAGAAGVVALIAIIVLLVGSRQRADRPAGRRGADGPAGRRRADRPAGGRATASTWVTPGPPRAGALALLALAAVGIATSAARVATSEHGLLPELSARGGTRPVSATVVHEPRPIATGWHVLVRVDEVAGTATRERAAVTLEGEPPPLGQRWRADASARPLPDGGYGRWLARQHATVVLDAQVWEPVGSPGPVHRGSEWIRERLRVTAVARQPDRLGGLLTGFVTGDTRLLPAADAEAMVASGLSHLTAVSGTHVAILVGGVLALCALLRIGARGRRRVLLLVLVGFAFLTRFQPSVLRAGTMGLVVLLAGARGVPRDARHGLAGAVLVLVLVDPLLASSLGLLLSASAAAGVLLLAPLLRDRLHRLPRRLAEVVAVTMGAQLAVVPLLLTTFGEVPLASVPANVVAVPAATVAVAGAFAAALVAVVAPGVAEWLFVAAGHPARVVLWSAHTFADVGWTVSAGRPATVVALGAGALLLLAAPRRRAARTAVAVTAVVALLASAAPHVGGRLPVRTLTVTAIDVGQGDAFLLESPRARVLVDAGGDDTAARWLRANGRRRVDLVIVTHGHLDHVGGAPDVLRAVPVGVVWYRPFPTDLPEATELLEVAAERQVPVRGPVPGDRGTVGGVSPEVFSPPPGRPYRWSRSELNDSSLVVLASWEGRRVLFPGDAEAAAQADLLELPDRLGRPELLEVELLAVPHHGSATTDPDLLRAVRPPVALISAGVDNRHGHPHPDVLAVLDELGAEVRRTDLEGTLRVEVPAARPRRQPVGSGHAARAPPRR